MNRNMKKWVNDMIASPVKKALPVLSFPAVQKMGITVRDLISSSEKQAEGMALIASTFDTAASVSLMDLSVEAECFGSTIRYSDDEVPTVIGHIVDTPEGAEALAVPSVDTCRAKVCIEAIRLAAGKITDRPVLAGVIGPFSLSGRLLDVSETMYYCYDEPEMVHTVLEKATEFIISYCLAFRSVGADGVVIAEPLAGIMSPEMSEEFSAAYMKKIVEAVQTDDFIVVYHNCGNAALKMMDSILSIGAPVIHLGNAVSMEEAVELVPESIAVCGNIDPSTQFRNGTPESIYKATYELMEKCCGHKNFVISSGCDIPPLSKWENIESFFKAVNDFYAK